MLHYSFYISISENEKIQKKIPTFTLDSLQLVKSPHDLRLHVLWKFVNIRVLLNIKSVHLHGYFKGKHKPKHLREFWWENIYLTFFIIFDYLVNLRDYLMCVKENFSICIYMITWFLEDWFVSSYVHWFDQVYI